MRFTTEEIAAATGGRSAGPPVEVDGVAIDSRLVRRGQLFAPIVAERDGHEFIRSAAGAGAAAYLSARGSFDDVEAPVIEVADTARALLDVGRLARRRLPDRVVGVTGSVGKTSTKDMLAAVLRARWSTTANERSFNNELGVPLTLAGAPEGTEATVVEMGARGMGHIAALCEVARPTVGVVTVVAGAHLELFGDLATVASAKSEIVADLPPAGTAVLNADDPLVDAMSGRTSAQVVRFAVESGLADVRAEGVRLGDDLRPAFRLASPWGAAEVHLAARGLHQVVNALAAAATGLALGVPVDDVADALGRAELSPSRMGVSTTAGGVLVIDDSYNANPTSMRAALDALAAAPARRRVAVVGTMAELGPGGSDEHAAMAAHASSLGIEVIAVDEPAYGPAGVEAVPDVAGALDALARRGLGDGDAVLVKASRVAALERVVEGLHADGR